MLLPAEKMKVEGLLSKHNFDITWAHVKERLSEDDLLDIIGKFDGIICGDDCFSENVYKNAKNLKVIVKWGTGIDSIKAKIAERYNVRVCRTPNAFTDPVADTTLVYILAFCRTIRDNDKIIKEGGWGKPQGYTLREKTVGIIGFGNIGRAVAKRLKPFGCRVMVNDLNEISHHISKELNVQAVKKDQIYQDCDFITLHTDLNNQSYHMINLQTLSKMKQRPFIINTSRGRVVKEEDLIHSLKNGQIQGAGLDVFETEPLPKNSPLRNMSNVWLSSHNSNSSAACWQTVHINSINMLVEAFQNV